MIVGTLHYMGLYIQLSATSRPNGHTEVENHLTGNGAYKCRLFFVFRFSIKHVNILAGIIDSEERPLKDSLIRVEVIYCWLTYGLSDVLY